MMLKGEKPQECSYCWNMEKELPHLRSLREELSRKFWYLTAFKKNALNNDEKRVYPRDLELRFSNRCNFACAYCDPVSSDTIHNNILQFGHFPTSSLYNNPEVFIKQKKLPTLPEKNNPYIAKFWECLPELLPHLMFIMLNGGEPLLHKNTFKLLDFFIKNKKEDLMLHIVSGLGIPEENLNLLIEKANSILHNQNVQNITIQVSLDHIEKRAEYIRHGLVYKELKKSVHRILDEIPGCNLIVRTSLSIFSADNFSDLAKMVLDLKKQYNTSRSNFRVVWQIHKLIYPPFLTIDLLPKKEKNNLTQALEYMKKNESINNVSTGFASFEIGPLRDIIATTETPMEENHHKKMKLDFFNFCNEYDLRNGSNFRELFPGMREFWSLCQTEFEEDIIMEVPPVANKIAPQFQEIDKKLSQVSSSLCIAKWKQATIHLNTGHTHSCHHPESHPIPLRELQLNHRALHNTSFKKIQRKLMLEGKLPKECTYCWNLENSNSTECFSDRHIKSSQDWALPHLQNIKNSSWQDDVDPSYLEVNFSSTCNLKCSYCSAQFSSSWQNELQRLGSYPFKHIAHVKRTDHNNLQKLITEHRIILPKPQGEPQEENPYLAAFWKWWPSLQRSLKIFRITGGEPLLDENTFKILDYLTAHPNKELSLEINSNLSISDTIFDQFLKAILKLKPGRDIKGITIFTSLESYGKKAEYARFGLNYQKVIDNIKLLVERETPIKVIIMSTYNALSVTSFTNFLQEVATIKKANKQHKDILLVDISYLRGPYRQTIKILPQHYLEPMQEALDFMKSDGNFTTFEMAKMQRIIDWFTGQQDQQDIDYHRSEFFQFFREHDKRRNTRFTTVFPEMLDLWDLCKETDRRYT